MAWVRAEAGGKRLGWERTGGERIGCDRAGRERVWRERGGLAGVQPTVGLLTRVGADAEIVAGATERVGDRGDVLGLDLGVVVQPFRDVAQQPEAEGAVQVGIARLIEEPLLQRERPLAGRMVA